MITSGLCGAQVNEISGLKGVDKYVPHLMGHEGFGEVVSVGDQVTKVKPGDYVILHWRVSAEWLFREQNLKKLMGLK